MPRKPKPETKRPENRGSDGELTYMGRPRKPIDFDILDGLLQIQCTQEECAAVFNVDPDTLADRVKEMSGETFSVYSRQKREAGKQSLRRTIWKNARKHPASAIFLAKNHLGMADKVEHGGPDGGPLETISRVVLVPATEEDKQQE